MESKTLGRIALAISLSMLTCVQLCLSDAAAQGEPTPPVTAPPPDLASVTTGATTSTGTQVIDVSQLASPGILSFDQPFQNLGQLYLISTNSSITSATLAAPHIVNGPGAVISTTLPTSISAPGALAGLNLILNATALNGTVYNAGTISSAGNLTINAQNIVNSLPSSVSGPSPFMQAIGSLNLNNVANLINSGQMIAVNNNININTASQIAQSLSVISNGGVFEALNGAINFRDDQFGDIKANLSILGGEFLSRELNMHSGKGVLSAEVNNTTGLVSLVGGELSFHQSTGILHLVHTLAKGDPVIGADGIDISGSHFTDGFDIGFHGNLLYSSGPLIISTSGGNVSFSGTSNRTYLNLAYTSINTGGGALLIDHGDITLGAGSSIDTSGPGTNGGGRVFIKASGDLIANNITINSGGGDIRLGGGIGYADDNFTLLPFEHHVELKGSTIYTSGATLQIGAPTGSISMQGSTIDTSGTAYRNGSIIQDTGIVQIGAGQSVNGGSIISPHGDITLMSGTKVIFSVLQDSFSFGFPVEREYGGNASLESMIFPGSSPGGLTVWSHQGSTTIGDISGPGSAIVAFAKDDLVVSKIANYSPNMGGAVQLSGNTVRTGEIQNSALGMGGEVKIVATSSVLVASMEVNGTVGGTVSVSVLDAPLEYRTPIIAKGLSGGGSITLVSLTRDASITSELNASTESGKGGLINLSAAGSLYSVEFDAKSHLGDGGTVRLKAGTELYAPRTIDVSAATQGNGGRIDIDAGTLVGVGASTLLKADGAGAGNGGIVNVSFAGSGGTANVEVLARGGTAGGNGGQTSWTARNGDLSIDPHSWNVSVRGPQGDGGKISLQATNGQILLADGNLIANGKGEGVGGTITMRTISSGDIVLPNSTRLVTNGGQGGQITIDSAGSLTTGAGGLVANSTMEGDGGTITLTAVGAITIAGTMQANGRGAGDGGTITINSQGTHGGGDGGGGGGGGVIIGLSAFSALEDPDASTSVSLERSIQAKAGAAGKGGIITIKSETGSIQFISTEPQSITADGGTGSGDGGKVDITSAANLFLDATISVSAHGGGTGGQIQLSSVGNLTVHSDVRANGAAVGDGGVIKLSSGVSIPNSGGDGGGSDDGGGGVIGLASVAAAQLETTGRISADAGASGKGGQIIIKALTGSALIGDSLEQNSITARGGSTKGDGGTVCISTGAYVTLNTIVSASAKGSGDGGFIHLMSEGQIDVQSIATANGADTGSGGFITIASSDNIYLSSSLKATGHGEGNGGNIKISAGTNLLSTGLISTNGGANGTGGEVTLSAGNSGELSQLSTITADGGGFGLGGKIGLFGANIFLSKTALISVDAGVEGQGGEISVQATEQLQIHDSTLSANGGQISGDGGAILVQAAGESSLSGDFSAKSTVGSGGFVSLQNSIGVLNIGLDSTGLSTGANIQVVSREDGDGGVVLINANQIVCKDANISAQAGQHSGNGGNITLESKGNSLSTSGRISANASGTGNGGTIKLHTGASGILLLDGKITANATGSGHSGEIHLDGNTDDLHITIRGEVTADSESGIAATTVMGHKGASLTVKLSENGELRGLPNKTKIGGPVALYGTDIFMGNGADRISPVTIEFTEIEASSSLTLDFDLASSKIVLLSSNQFIPKRMTANGDIKISTPTLVVENRLDSNQGSIFITSGTPSLTIRGHDHSSITASERLSLTNVENITFSRKVSLISLSLTDPSPEVRASRVLLLQNSELNFDQNGLIETKLLTMGNGSVIVVGGSFVMNSQLNTKLTLASKGDLIVNGPKAEIQAFTGRHNITIGLEAQNGSVTASFGRIHDALLTGFSQKSFSVTVNSGDASVGNVASGGALTLYHKDVNGELSVTGSAALAAQGNMEITSLGRLTVRQDASLTASGRIVLSIGELKSVQPGPIPTFMTVTTGGSGQVIFGLNGIRVDCCGTTAQAIDSSIIFNTGKHSGDRIHIEGGVSFVAKTAALPQSSDATNCEVVLPVSFVEARGPNRVSYYFHNSDDFMVFGGETFSVDMAPGNVLRVNGREVIVDATKQINLGWGATSIRVAAHSTMILSPESNVLHLIVLTGRCSLVVDNTTVTINPGEELVIAATPLEIETVLRHYNVSRRLVRAGQIGKNLYFGSAEVSILSIHEKSPILRTVVSSQPPLAEKLLKTCAALHLVTESHGPYDE